MKKTYLQPAVEMVDAETMTMLCTSLIIEKSEEPVDDYFQAPELLTYFDM